MAGFSSYRGLARYTLKIDVTFGISGQATSPKLIINFQIKNIIFVEDELYIWDLEVYENGIFTHISQI